MTDEFALTRLCPFCGKMHQWEEINNYHWGPNKAILCGRRVLFNAYHEADMREITDLWNNRPYEVDAE